MYQRPPSRYARSTVFVFDRTSITSGRRDAGRVCRGLHGRHHVLLSRTVNPGTVPIRVSDWKPFVWVRESHSRVRDSGSRVIWVPDSDSRTIYVLYSGSRVICVPDPRSRGICVPDPGSRGICREGRGGSRWHLSFRKDSSLQTHGGRSWVVSITPYVDFFIWIIIRSLKGHDGTFLRSLNLDRYQYSKDLVQVRPTDTPGGL